MSQTEFKENWLQALMMASDNPFARRIRPWMTDIAAVSAAEPLPGQTDAATRIWDYGAAHGLRSLLESIPLRQLVYRFEDDDQFQWTPLSPAAPIASGGDFCQWLGLVPVEFSWRGTITHSDWTNLLRREAVRQSQGLNLQSIPTTSRVEVSCRAQWDTRHWTIAFDQPEWLRWEPGAMLLTARPGMDAIESSWLDAISFANQHFRIAGKPSGWGGPVAPWSGSVEPMSGLHDSILRGRDMGVSDWFRRVWTAVWPVVYRERNRLRGTCDLPALRKEVAECFRSAPQLTEWMFVFARVLCALVFERGLGIAADFVDEDS